jgi:outer membrane protein
LENLAELTLRAEMQNLVSEVIVAYTTLVAQQQNEKVLLKLQESAKARKQLIEVRMSAGLANNSDLFLAELDLDNAAQALVTSSQQMMRASAALKSLMKSINPNVLRVVEEVPESLQPERLSADGLFQNNPEVNMSGTSVKIAVQSEKEASALRYPKVTLTAAYGYLLSQSQAGFSLYNQTYGASGSLGINVPLFSGNVYKNNHQNAIIARKNTELEAEQVKNDIMQHYILAWQLYESANARQILLESSVKTASDYLALMTLRFNEGQSTVIELREAERSFEEANYRKISNEVTLKLAETDILRISGQLIR